MRVIDDMVDLARRHAELILEFQQVVPIGLGETLTDIVASGYMHASYNEIRDANGRLDLGAAEPGMVNGFARWYQGGLPRFRLSPVLARVYTDEPRR